MLCKFFLGHLAAHAVDGNAFLVDDFLFIVGKFRRYAVAIVHDTVFVDPLVQGLRLHG